MTERTINQGEKLRPLHSKEWWGLGLMIQDEETMTVSESDYADYEAVSAMIDKSFGHSA